MTDDIPTIRVVGAAIHRDGKVLIGKRPVGGTFGGKWEFPGGKVEPGEHPEQALVREIREELGLSIRPLYRLGTETFATASRLIHLEVFWAEPVGPLSELRRREHLALAWVDASTMHDFDFALPDLPLLAPVALALTRQRSLC